MYICMYSYIYFNAYVFIYILISKCVHMYKYIHKIFVYTFIN